MAERSLVGEVMAELDATNFGGIHDYVKHQVIRELVERNKQLEAEFKPKGTSLYRVREHLDIVDKELEWKFTGRGRIDMIQDLKRSRNALKSFVRRFECDFVMDGEIVDEPNKRWGQLENAYFEAKNALKQQ